MSKQFTANDVKEAGTVEKGLHIIIDNDVYEMGSFVDEHPGGAKILKRVGGKDASKQFWKVSEEYIHIQEDLSSVALRSPEVAAVKCCDIGHTL